MDFSLDPFIFSMRRPFGRHREALAQTVDGCIFQDLFLLYHKHSTESTLFCNFSFLNCELVHFAPSLRYFRSHFVHSVHFSIFKQISNGIFRHLSGFFHSFPVPPLGANVLHGALCRSLTRPDRRNCPLRLQQSAPAPAFCRISSILFHHFRFKTCR